MAEQQAQIAGAAHIAGPPLLKQPALPLRNVMRLPMFRQTAGRSYVDARDAEAIALIERLAASETVDIPAGVRLLELWTISGHQIRTYVDDDDLIIKAFRRSHMPYEGPGILVYRGEIARQVEQNRIGLNWTPNRACAEGFANGLCRTYGSDSRGCYSVLLSALAPPKAIIAVPNAHSIYLGEDAYVIDPIWLEELSVMPWSYAPTD